MISLEQKIAEIESHPSRLHESEIALRRRHIEDFMAISAFEGLYPSKLSIRLQELFVAEKLTASEYIELSRRHSSELRA